MLQKRSCIQTELLSLLVTSIWMGCPLKLTKKESPIAGAAELCWPPILFIHFCPLQLYGLNVLSMRPNKIKQCHILASKRMIKNAKKPWHQKIPATCHHFSFSTMDSHGSTMDANKWLNGRNPEANICVTGLWYHRHAGISRASLLVLQGNGLPSAWLGGGSLMRRGESGSCVDMRELDRVEHVTV